MLRFTFFVLLSLPLSAIEFNRDIRPILSDRCFACHGPDAGNRKTKMRLDVEASAKQDMGKGRFAVVAGDASASELYRRINSDSKTLRMPPAYAGHEKLADRAPSRLSQYATLHVLFPHPLTKSATNKTHSPQSYGAL